ncbi:putative bifunctional diguanylate cyclase/phosphodiesterase [Pokkaliibacter sp. CJK22405]|uniref:putative bifunctional diguanylate cyclase/phosphodiesterase n=1 Tax=Pokkaliibacter sp. CJK22405 TaxID=3384615 RepID=UPI0039852902
MSTSTQESVSPIQALYSLQSPRLLIISLLVVLVTLLLATATYHWHAADDESAPALAAQTLPLEVVARRISSGWHERSQWLVASAPISQRCTQARQHSAPFAIVLQQDVLTLCEFGSPEAIRSAQFSVEEVLEGVTGDDRGSASPTLLIGLHVRGYTSDSWLGMATHSDAQRDEQRELLKRYQRAQQGETQFNGESAPLSLVYTLTDEALQGLEVMGLQDAAPSSSLLLLPGYALVLLTVVLLGLLVLLVMGHRSEHQRRLLVAALSAAANAVFITDWRGRIIWVNRAFEKLTGYTREFAVGKEPSILNSGKQSTHFYQRFWTTIAKGEVWQGEVVNKTHEGELITVNQTVTPLLNSQHQPRYYVAIHENITEQKRTEQRALYLARHDTLTHLPNRHWFHELLQEALETSDHLGLIYLDLDRFKEVNDSLGHPAGDALLITLANRFRAILPGGDLLARLGGDEFAFIVRSCRDENELAVMASQLLQVIREPSYWHHQQLSISASLGVVCSAPDMDAAMLVQAAELAMYNAKESRSGYAFFDVSLSERLKRKNYLEQKLRQALEHEGRGLWITLQPQLSLETGELVGAEVLVRWEEASPGEFVPLAEGSDLILTLGDWIMEESLKALCALDQQHIVLPRLSINFSAAQLQRIPVADRLYELICRYGIDPQRIEVEITETALMQPGEQVRENIATLRKLGIGLALDDFGTGYSSLSMLKDWPVQVVKIDTSFVREIGISSTAETIIRGMIAMTGSMGLNVVAEGIEEPAQRDFLRACGCDMGQGYLFAKPLAPSTFVQYCRQLSIAEPLDINRNI